MAISVNASSLDHVVGFSQSQLVNMNIRSEASLTLLYTHECAHIAMLHHKTQESYPWSVELICDFFVGVRARQENISADDFAEALQRMSKSSLRPPRELRVKFMEYGNRAAAEMRERNEEITVKKSLEYCVTYIRAQKTLVKWFGSSD